MIFLIHPCHLLLILFLLVANLFAKEFERFRFGKGNVLMDEAQLQIAEEKDYSRDFEEDLQSNAEFGDVYDERLAELPEFEVHKLGKNIGWTQLPIVTRKKALWSTPAPRTRQFSHSWAWLYTKPPTAVTQKRRTTLSLTATTPEIINNYLKKEKIDKNVEKNKEKIELTNERKIKNTTPKKITSETKMQIQTKTTIAMQLEKEKNVRTTITSSETPTTTFSTNKLSAEQAEKENALERLRKLLRTANLRGAFPSDNQKVVVEVRSNVIAIKPAETKNTDSSQKGGFAWPRSWSNELDDKLAIRSWARMHANQPEHQVLSPLHNISSEIDESPFSFPTHSDSLQSFSTQFTTVKLSSATPTTIKIPTTTTRTTTRSSTTTRKKGIFKPTFIHSGTYRHTGPTFNCRVLDAAVDGTPSENNDKTCPLDFPGIASDKSCKCTYEVAGRDEEGCATGFIYTCLRTPNLNKNDLKT